jgi:hypothetical protein
MTQFEKHQYWTAIDLNGEIVIIHLPNGAYITDIDPDSDIA